MSLRLPFVGSGSHSDSVNDASALSQLHVGKQWTCVNFGSQIRDKTILSLYSNTDRSVCVFAQFDRVAKRMTNRQHTILTCSLLIHLTHIVYVHMRKRTTTQKKKRKKTQRWIYIYVNIYIKQLKCPQNKGGWGMCLNGSDLFTKAKQQKKKII